MSQYQLLVVDDDKLVIEAIRLILPNHWKMLSTNNIQDLDPKRFFHAAFVDMHLTGDLNIAEGPVVIAKINEMHPQVEIVAMSGDLSMDLMESCLAKGAKKFLAKPLSGTEVISTLEKIEAIWMMRQLESRGSHSITKWIGTSKASENIKNKIANYRSENGPILIDGETGSGKEVAFRLLNQQEGNRPFVAVNMTSIPENLFESELFGHVRGAFTGADTQKVGLAEAAHGGDLFLDEIEALPMSLQPKLLRFLETGEIRKVGGKENIIVKTRVIAATNQNLNDLVKQGKFREDLLFRLSGKKLLLPPLRERLEDIPELCEFFLSLEKPRVNKTFSKEAFAAMKTYNWPGNVRELKRICEQLFLISPLPIIRADDVKALIQPALPVLSVNATDQVKVNSTQELNSSDRNTVGSTLANLELSIDQLQKGLAQLLSEYEAKVIQQCLKHESDIDKASQILKMSRSNLYKKIKDYNLES